MNYIIKFTWTWITLSQVFNSRGAIPEFNTWWKNFIQWTYIIYESHLNLVHIRYITANKYDHSYSYITTNRSNHSHREGKVYISGTTRGKTKGKTTFLPTVEEGSQSTCLVHPLAWPWIHEGELEISSPAMSFNSSRILLPHTHSVVLITARKIP
jgi:hypothetical protein